MGERIMETYISFLRGINVGGNKKIKMDDLSDLYESLGLINVKTYIQSGNVVFNTVNLKPDELEQKIETAVRNTFGFDVKVMIRTKGELKKIIKKNPFSEEYFNHLHVMFLSGIHADPPIKELDEVKDDFEEYFISGKEIYIYYHNGVAKTNLSNGFIEKKLNVSATTRNWNTVNRLAEMSD